MIAVSRELLAVLFAGIWQGAGLALGVAAMLALTGRRLNAATRCVILQGAVVAVAIVPVVTTLPNVVTQAAFVHVFSISNAPPYSALTRDVMTPGPRRIDVILSDRAVLLLTELWIAGVLAFVLRIGAGSLQLARLLRRSSPLGNRDGVRIFESPDLGVPVAVGFGRPSIVVPTALAARPGEAFECIVLHELAHVRRRDAYANACARVVNAFLFFNPASVLLLRAVALEREVACDDWAVARSRDLAKYTASLASFALWSSSGGPSSAFTTSGFGSATVARLNRLEDKRRNGAITLSLNTVGGSGLMLLTIAFIVNAFMPAIAFASQVPVSNVTIASTSCRGSEIRYIGGPAPHPLTHVPSGLRTLVRVEVSPSGKALGATLSKSSGDKDFDRAVVDAAKKGVYSAQTQACRPLAGSYLFEAKTG